MFGHRMDRMTDLHHHRRGHEGVPRHRQRGHHPHGVGDRIHGEFAPQPRRRERPLYDLRELQRATDQRGRATGEDRRHARVRVGSGGQTRGCPRGPRGEGDRVRRRHLRDEREFDRRPQSDRGDRRCRRRLSGHLLCRRRRLRARWRPRRHRRARHRRHLHVGPEGLRHAARFAVCVVSDDAYERELESESASCTAASSARWTTTTGRARPTRRQPFPSCSHIGSR